MNGPVQLAIPVLLKQRHGFQKQLLERVRRNLSELDRRLATQTVCNRLTVEGGWYAVLRVPATQSSEDQAIDLLKSQGISVHPGNFYELPPTGFLVVSLLTSEEAFLTGMSGVLASIT